jgi:hypothetical protein
MSVDSNATWPGVQNCSTSAWTWNDIPRHTSEREADLAAQNQVVGAILHAETTCSSTTEPATEAPQTRMVDVSWRDSRLRLSSLAGHGRSYILPRNDVSHDTYYSNGNVVREPFTIPTPFLEWPIRTWTRNDISIFYSGHHAGVVPQSQTTKTGLLATTMRLSVSIRKMNDILISAFDRLDGPLGSHASESRIENTISSYVGHSDGNTPSATPTTVSAASALLSLMNLIELFEPNRSDAHHRAMEVGSPTKTAYRSMSNKVMEALNTSASGNRDLLGRHARYQSPATVFWIDEFESSYSKKLDLDFHAPRPHAWNAIPRRSDIYSCGRVFSELVPTSLWTWIDIPRDGNEFATGPVYQRDSAPPLHANVHARLTWHWNDIPRHSNCSGIRAGTIRRPTDPVVRGNRTSMWTWNDIPRDGNKRAISWDIIGMHVSVVVKPNWLKIGIG